MDNDSSFQRYSRDHTHYYEKIESDLLQKGLSLVSEIAEEPILIDLGCGDGRIIFALNESGLLNNFSEVVGVDISQIRIRRLLSNLPFVKGVVSDALDVKLPDSYSDFIVCSQVVEHVEDDGLLVLEMRRLLKDGGLVYISSVVKKWYGVSVFLRDGSFRLDPTHIREYSSVEEFVNLVNISGFDLVDVRTRLLKVPLIDPFVWLLAKLEFVEKDPAFFQKRNFLDKIRRIKIPIVGYDIVEVLIRKNGFYLIN